MKHIRGELEVLRAQNLALRKTQIVHRSTLCTSAHPFQKFPHRLPKSLIVEHVKLGRCDPTTRAALIAALRLECTFRCMLPFESWICKDGTKDFG